MSNLATFAAQIQDRLQPFTLLAQAVAQDQITEDQARSVMISSLNQTISAMDDVVRYLRSGKAYKPHATASYAGGRTYARIRWITRMHSPKGVLFLKAYRVVTPVPNSLKGVFLWTKKRV